MTLSKLIKFFKRSSGGKFLHPGDELQWGSPYATQSFSQSGEDILLKGLFTAIGVETGTFIDVGANDPAHFSNTYLLYRTGWRGICIEPQTHLCERLREFRPNDEIINAGLGVESGTLSFYQMHPDTLSTFDSVIAHKYQQLGHPIIAEMSVPVLSVGQLVHLHALPESIDLVSIDIEGDESAIICELIAQGIRPKVIICETRAYSPTLGGAREQEKIDRLCELGYVVFADTYINSIFLDARYADGERVTSHLAI